MWSLQRRDRLHRRARPHDNAEPRKPERVSTLELGD